MITLTQPPPPFLDIAGFGGAGDGVTDDTNAWAAAIAQTQAKSFKGGTIICPPGFNSFVSGGITLDGLANITILMQGGAEAGTRIFTNRTDGGAAISAKGTNSITIAGGEVQHQGPFGTAAAAIDFTGTSGTPTNFPAIIASQVVAATNASSIMDLVRLPFCLYARTERCIFSGGRYQLQGMASGQFLNLLDISLCSFGHYAIAAMHNLSESTTLRSSGFEPGTSGANAALVQDANVPLQGFEMVGCQCPDETAQGTHLVINGKGISIRSSLFGGTATNRNSTAIQFNATSSGVEIKANTFQTIGLGIDKNAQTVTAEIGPNDYTNVTTHHNFTAAGTLYVEA